MRLLGRMARALFPSQLLGSIRDELTILPLRVSTALAPDDVAHRFPGKTRIHLGSGKRVTAGWINVDIVKEADLRWDLRKALPFSSGFATAIYSEHFLEHLEQADAVFLLGECYRVLGSDCLIRLGVPDVEIYIRAYATGDRAFFRELAGLGGAQPKLRTPAEVINQMFRMGGHHRFAWDFETLKLVLEEVGFVDVKRFEPGRCSLPELCLDDPEHAFETLYVEARKA